MSRPVFAFAAEDVSALARALKTQLAARAAEKPEAGPPGHVELLNMLARGAGWKNFQHFRAQFDARDRLAAPPPPAPVIDWQRIEKLARLFDAGGRLTRWPGKFNQQQTCLWVLWSRLPARRRMSEREINAVITDSHAFGDYALIRREMVDAEMVVRTPDGAIYRRIEQAVPADAAALIRVLAARADPAA